MIVEKMLDAGLFAFFIGVITSIIYIVYTFIRKKDLKDNFNPIIFGILFIIIYIFVKFFLVNLINSEKEDISKYIVNDRIEKKQWNEEDIIQLKKFYEVLYDTKLMDSVFRDYKDKMLSTHIIYKNEIIKSAVDCVIINIKKEFYNNEQYIKSNFNRSNNELINECISNKKVADIYKNLTNSWNEFTKTEIEDNVFKGTIIGIQKNQPFTNKEIESKNNIMANETATCVYENLKEQYPNYSEFNYGFYEIKLSEVRKNFDNIKDNCLNKSLKKWYK